MFSNIRARSEVMGLLGVICRGVEGTVSRDRCKDDDAVEAGMEVISTANFRRLLLSRSRNCCLPFAHSSFASATAPSSSSTRSSVSGNP